MAESRVVHVASGKVVWDPELPPIDYIARYEREHDIAPDTTPWKAPARRVRACPGAGDIVAAMAKIAKRKA